LATSDDHGKLRKAQYRKKLLVHIFLSLAILVDIPMYINFIRTGEYDVYTYAFHKLESALLFAAFSITIADWGALLHDIREDTLSNLILRRTTLLVLCAVYALISLASCLSCCVINDLQAFTSSHLYIFGLFSQIFMSLTITCIMLHAGLKLSQRIKSITKVMTGSEQQDTVSLLSPNLRAVAAGRIAYHPITDTHPCQLALSNTLSTTAATTKPILTSTSTARSSASPAQSISLLMRPQSLIAKQAKDFQLALWRLNIVMTTCALCNFFQVSV
jgi:hypothetical protein